MNHNNTQSSNQEQSNFKIQFCQKGSGHKEYQLNQICLNSQCNELFEPVCIQCIEENRHKHENNFKSLRNFLQKLQDLECNLIPNRAQQEIPSEPIQNHKYIQEEWFQDMQNSCKKLQEEIKQLSQNIDSLKIYFRDSIKQNSDQACQLRESHPTQLTIKKLIEALNKEGIEDQQMLYQNLKQLRPLLIVQNDGDIQVAKPEFIKNNDNVYFRLQSCQNILEKKMTELEKLVKQTVQESVSVFNSTSHLQQQLTNLPDNKNLQWKFVPSQYSESKNLYTQKNGTTYSGGDGMLGVLYSEKSFSQGKHYFNIKIVNLEKSSTKLYMGIIEDQNKDLQPGTNNPYQFLYGDGGNFMKKLQQVHIGEKLKENSILRVVLDFKDNNFYIRLQDDGAPYYEIDQKCKLVGKNWRFTIFAHWRDLKLEVLETK